MTKIYTYYENLNDPDQEMHESLLGVWEESWKKQGFDPIILSIDDAKKSSLFNQYMDLVQEVHIEVRGGAGLKQKNPVHRYWLAAQREIAAFHTIQEPSFISDYDVINKRFRFDHKIDSKLYWRDECCSCFASADSHGWEKYILFLIAQKNNIVNWCKKHYEERNRRCFGDQDFLEAVYHQNTLSDVMKVFNISRHHTKICRHYDPEEKDFPNMEIYHLGHGTSWKRAERLGYTHNQINQYRLEMAKEIINA
jgi:hypothetical protein